MDAKAPDNFLRACPVCTTTDIIVLIDIPQMPVFCNVLWNGKDEALHAPRGDIQLGFCTRCSHIYNRRFDPSLVRYSQNYENSLHFSSRFQSYAHQLADRLVRVYALQNKDLVEIGSGQGDFLEMVCDRGENRGIGFDPSYRSTEGADPDSRIRIIPDYYSLKYAQYPADFILSRHVLEHVDRPNELIASLRQTIGDRHHVVVFFEVPNALYTIQALGIWDIIFEHFSYFTHFSLREIFSRNGFNILQISEAFNGQFLTIEASPAPEQLPALVNLSEGLGELSRNAAVFSQSYHQKVSAWQYELGIFSQQDKKGVVWGAGSKGVTFLNILRDYQNIEYVVDINPRKAGKFVSGSGQEIVPPNFLAAYQPDYVIIMNPNYHAEIQESLDLLGVNAQILNA